MLVCTCDRNGQNAEWTVTEEKSDPINLDSLAEYIGGKLMQIEVKLQTANEEEIHKLADVLKSLGYDRVMPGEGPVDMEASIENKPEVEPYEEYEEPEPVAEEPEGPTWTDEDPIPSQPVEEPDKTLAGPEITHQEVIDYTTDYIKKFKEQNPDVSVPIKALLEKEGVANISSLSYDRLVWFYMEVKEMKRRAEAGE